MQIGASLTNIPIALIILIILVLIYNLVSNKSIELSYLLPGLVILGLANEYLLQVLDLDLNLGISISLYYLLLNIDKPILEQLEVVKITLIYQSK